MAKWPELDPIAQNELLGEMTQEIVEALPPGWREVAIDFRAVGRNLDVAVGLQGADGSRGVWDPPEEVWRMFQRLRGGMYQENEGTWFSARFMLEPPGRFTIQYNWQNEPDFQPVPALEEYAIEQERFPRTEAYMPQWFRDRLAAAAN